MSFETGSRVTAQARRHRQDRKRRQPPVHQWRSLGHAHRIGRNQLPPEYGNWNIQYHRFLLWRDARIGEKLLDFFLDDPDMECLMMDTSWFEGKKRGRKGERPVWVFPNQQFVWPGTRMIYKTDAVIHKLSHMITRKIAGA